MADVVTKVEHHTGFAAVEQGWEALAEATGAPPFLRPGWVRAWCEAFGHGEPQALALSRGGELVAVLPLEATRGVLRSPTNWHTPWFGAVAADAEARDLLYAQLAASHRRRVQAGFLMAGTEADSLRSALATSRRVAVRRLGRSPYIDTGGDVEAYDAALSRNRRKGLRRRRRRLAEAGVLEFAVHEAFDERLLEEAFAVESSGWKGHRGTAIASDPATRRFYTEVARWAAERGWLRLSFLRVDGRPLAFDLALEHGGAWYSLKAGYDERDAAYGPGIVLLDELLRRAIAADLRSFELLGGEEDYKAEWASGYRELLLVQGFARTLAGRLDGAVSVEGRRAAKGAKSLVHRIRS